jgi:preprotein translocase subunit YajC
MTGIAYAMGSNPAQQGGGSGLEGIFMLVAMFAIFYFLLIRPQQKRRKEQANLVAKLAKGDEVVTASGILGRITKIEGNFLVLEVSDKVELKFQRDAVHAVLPKGTLKAL